jgi:cytochrome c oxidase subunit 3
VKTWARQPPAPGVPPLSRAPELVPAAVLGMLIFVFVELMMFAGLISAHSIVRASNLFAWPPPGQPRLPIEQTALNTVALLLSGVALFLGQRAYRQDPASARVPLAIAMALGAFFVVFQGLEWLALIGEGLTLTSSNHGSFFYLIVGMHALHAIAALGVLASAGWLLQTRRLRPARLAAACVFWYFVVGLWPILYWRVYL